MIPKTIYICRKNPVKLIFEYIFILLLLIISQFCFSTTLAFETIRSAYRGEETPAEEAIEFWRTEGLIGGLRQFGFEVRSVVTNPGLLIR